METIQTLLSWVSWLGVVGVVGGLLLILFAPALARVAGEFLQPIAKSLGELVVWFFRDVLWEGAKDMADNFASIVFVIVMVVAGGYFLSTKCDPKPAVDKAIAELRQNYKFVPLTAAEKKARRRAQNQAAPCWYCLW
jgi:hypothetical protein